MTIKSKLLFPIFAVAFSACNVNLNLPNKNRDNADVKMRWSALVCSSKAKTVTLFAGTGASDAENFAVWTPDAAQKTFDLPANVQTLSKIYLKAVAADRNPVEMCVLYDGAPKKRVEFNDEEDVHVNMTDTEGANKCRCTE